MSHIILGFTLTSSSQKMPVGGEIVPCFDGAESVLSKISLSSPSKIFRRCLISFAPKTISVGVPPGSQAALELVYRSYATIVGRGSNWSVLESAQQAPY